MKYLLEIIEDSLARHSCAYGNMCTLMHKDERREVLFSLESTTQHDNNRSSQTLNNFRWHQAIPILVRYCFIRVVV